MTTDERPDTRFFRGSNYSESPGGGHHWRAGVGRGAFFVFATCLTVGWAWPALGRGSDHEFGGVADATTIPAEGRATAVGGLWTRDYRASSTNAIATFRVGRGAGSGYGRWVIAGDNLQVTVGAPVLWDSKGAASGYRVRYHGLPTSISSESWVGVYKGLGSSYIVALYANNSNPRLRPSPSGMITPGYVPDLGAYNMGRGAGWVAVDGSTGNGLLLAVSSNSTGDPRCGSGGACLGLAISALGQQDSTTFAKNIQAPDSVAFALAGQIPGNNPFTAYGCTVNPYSFETTSSTCENVGLRVRISPVGVVRGDVLGTRVSPSSGGSATGGAWSTGGSYTLQLTGVTVTT